MMEKWKGCFLLETWRVNDVVCLWRLDGEIESEVMVWRQFYVLSFPSEFYEDISFYFLGRVTLKLMRTRSEGSE